MSNNNSVIVNGITIPSHELEITTSRSSGPGGQHVNKTDTRVTVRWNVKNTTILNESQKVRILQKLQATLTNEGELIVSNSSTRSQLKNKELALEQLTYLVRKALYIPKKRIKTNLPKAVKEARLQAKTKRSIVKQLRKKDYSI